MNNWNSPKLNYHSDNRVNIDNVIFNLNIFIIDRTSAGFIFIHSHEHWFYWIIGETCFVALYLCNINWLMDRNEYVWMFGVTWLTFQFIHRNFFTSDEVRFFFQYSTVLMLTIQRWYNSIFNCIWCFSCCCFGKQ